MMTDRKDMLDLIDARLESRKTLALYRMELLLEHDDENATPAPDGDAAIVGLPPLFVSLLHRAVETFFVLLRVPATKIYLPDHPVTKDLLRLLSMYRRIVELDATLNEELGMGGAHLLLSKLMKVDATSVCETESDQDAVMEVQDVAGEIAASCPSFPRRATPLTTCDLKRRLPLVFRIIRPPTSPTNSSANKNDHHGSSSETLCKEEELLVVLINQVSARQTAQKDVGFVMWPSAVALATWLISNPKVIQGKTVLELGAGCGLVGLVAASLQAKKITLSDFNQFVVKNLAANLELNGLDGEAERLDFYQQDAKRHGWVTSSSGDTMEPVDVILASDVICQPEDAFAVARTIAGALKEGGTGIVVSADSKHRFGVEKFIEACNLVGLDVSSRNASDTMYEKRGVFSDSATENMKLTSGFVDGMRLTMYMVGKPGR